MSSPITRLRLIGFVYTDSPLPLSENLFPLANVHCHCSICLQDTDKVSECVILPCCHKFHRVCFEQQLASGSTKCAICCLDLVQFDVKSLPKEIAWIDW